eukprot:1460550-Prymnesium_polylepis.1
MAAAAEIDTILSDMSEAVQAYAAGHRDAALRAAPAPAVPRPIWAQRKRSKRLSSCWLVPFYATLRAPRWSPRRRLSCRHRTPTVWWYHTCASTRLPLALRFWRE